MQSLQTQLWFPWAGKFLEPEKKTNTFFVFFFFFLNGIPVEISFQKNVLIMVANQLARTFTVKQVLSTTSLSLFKINIHTYTKTIPDIKNIHASDINKHPHSMLESTRGQSFMLLTKHQYQHNVFMEKCKAFMQVNKLTTISTTYQEHTAQSTEK